MYCKEWQLSQLKEQRGFMIEAIETGNWRGYTENLEVRKQQLKEVNKQIDKLENE